MKSAKDIKKYYNFISTNESKEELTTYSCIMPQSHSKRESQSTKKQSRAFKTQINDLDNSKVKLLPYTDIDKMNKWVTP